MIEGRIRSSTVSVGYYNIDNFGDQLTPDIFEYYGLKTVHCPNFRFSSAVGVGSILHLLPENYRGYILGSGLIKDGTAHFKNSKALLVRGHLTRKNLGLSDTISVGDPGLISDKVYEFSVAQEQCWDIGIIPHYRDKKNEQLKKILTEKGRLTVHVIDVRETPREVVREISKCTYILSSSLHGLIVADSLGIPNGWIKLSNGLIGGDFKFNDYYSCFGITRSPIEISKNEKLESLIEKVELIPSDQVNKIKENIHSVYSDFSKNINSSLSKS